MRGNSFGSVFRLTSFGESHGAAIGGVIDGCPAGLELDLAAVQVEMDRRRPGSTLLGTTRNEGDTVEFLSGLLSEADQPITSPRPSPGQQPTTLGTPIAFIIRNSDAKSGDYDHLKDAYRPGHADLTWEQKFGLRDHRGGGRASARETAVRVAAGAIARQLISSAGVHVNAFVSQVGSERIRMPVEELDLAITYENDVRCPDPEGAKWMSREIELARMNGDTVGGMITCVISGTPAGLGEPVFDKLHADLGKAMLSINAVKGFQIGSGFAAAGMRGSEHNDLYKAPPDTGKEGVIIPISGQRGVMVRVDPIRTATNRSGGVQGGISTGEDIVFDIAFKPASTLMRDQQSVDRDGKAITLEGKGRHDPCVVPRAVPIVEAMACLVIADHLLRQRSSVI